MGRESRVAVVIALCLTFAAASFASAASAAESAPTAAQVEDTIPISVDGTPLAVKGRLEEGRTMAPIAEFARELGMSVREDPATGKVEIGDGTRTISFDVGKNSATRGDHRIWVSPGAMAFGERTYAPVRFISESMGFRVRWDAAARAVALFRVTENPIKIGTITDTAGTKRLEINMQYPEIEGLENKEAETRFNEHFRKAADACRAAGEKSVKDLEEYFDSPDHRDFQVQAWLNYEVKYNRDDIISVVLTQYEYTGGAHGMTYQTSYNMNIKTGQVYTLSDLFKSEIDYVALISDEVKKQIAARGEDIFLLAPFEAIRKDQDFYIKDGAVVVYFELYEYTPYAAGIPEFAVEFQTLEGSLDPQFEALVMGGGDAARR